MTISDRIRVKDVRLLSDNHYVLKSTTLGTNDVTGGLPTNGTDRTTFKAATPGQYVIACGVPGHAPSGMWINFVVSADAKAPTYTTK